MKINLRLGIKDKDLILLTQYYQAPELLRKAIAYYQGNLDAAIPLPPQGDAPDSAMVTFKLEKESDLDYISFLNSIPPENRSTVIRLLLRHALEQCDIRPFLQSSGRSIRRKGEQKRSAPSSLPDVPAVKQPQVVDMTYKEQTDDSDEEDVFSGI